MLERFLNKNVKVWVLNHFESVMANVMSREIKGVLEEIDDDYIMISNNILVAKKYIVVIEEC